MPTPMSPMDKIPTVGFGDADEVAMAGESGGKVQARSCFAMSVDVRRVM